MHSSLRAFLLVSVTLVVLVTYADAVCENPALDHCNDCASSTATECSEGGCDAGYHIADAAPDKGKCVQNTCKVEFCELCNDKGECIKCDDGSTLNSGSCAPNTCAATVQNCERCTAITGTTCHTCSPGYKVNKGDGSCVSNTCDASVLNCERCTEDEGTTCHNCMPGYHPNTAVTSCESNTCAATVQNCVRCTEDNGSACQTCSPGYKVKNSLCVKSSDAASRAPGSALAAVAVLVTGAAAYAM